MTAPAHRPAGDETSEAPQETRNAARGGVAVLGAKVFFIATGLLQQALLPRAVGLADYGALSRVLAVSNVFNNVVVASSTQGVSRAVAAAGANPLETLRATLRIHAGVALAAGLLLGLSAPFVAHFEHAPEVLAPLLVMTGVLVVYGVYAPLVGYLNGRGLFSRQAALDVVAATLRTTLILTLGTLFTRRGGALAHALGTSPGVLGATVGMVVAAVGVILVALRWTGTGSASHGVGSEGVPRLRVYLALLWPVMLAQLFTNGLMQADILVLGRYLSLAAPATGAQSANEWVAVYRACQLFAFLPYQMLFSVSQILFPMVARARVEDGDARVAELVRRGCRIGAIVCGMLVVVVLVLPGSLINFAYGGEVAFRGAETLRILALGQAAFAMLGLATTILVSLGRARDAMKVTLSALCLLGAACVVMIPRATFGAGQLHATALATTTALVLALALGVQRVRRVAGAFVPWRTALRVAACVACAFVLGGVMPRVSELLTPVAAGAVVLAYLVILFVTGELSKSDVALVTSVIARRTKR